MFKRFITTRPKYAPSRPINSFHIGGRFKATLFSPKSDRKKFLYKPKYFVRIVPDVETGRYIDVFLKQRTPYIVSSVEKAGHLLVCKIA